MAAPCDKLPAMERVLFLFDGITEGELSQGKINPNARTVRLFQYLTRVVKGMNSDAQTTLLVASPKPGKTTAKEYREHAPNVQKAMAEFDPTLVVVLGKSALYPISPYLPSNFPRTLKYQKLWGRYFPLHLGGTVNGRRAVFAPSISMVFAGKEQEGGYLYLRTIQECVTDALLRRTDSIKTVSHYISDRESLASLERQWTDPKQQLNRIVSGAVVGFDTETTGLNVISDKVRTVQFSFKDGEAYVIPFNLLPADDWTQLLHRIGAAGYSYVLQNGKYDSKILRSNGVILPDFQELSIAHALVDEREGTHNLDFIGSQILGSGKDEIGKDKLVGGPIDRQFIEYAGRDTDITRRAFNVILPAVRERRIYDTLTRTQNILAYGEHRGIRLDVERLEDLSRQADVKIREYKQMFAQLELNPRSSQQAAKALGLTGSADKKALEDVDSDLARAIIDYRGLQKVKRTYLDRLMASAEIDGRFHPDIRLAGPVTGRTSSGSGSAPKDMLWLPINSQNIPRPAQGQAFKYLSEELRSQLRHLFVADEGYVMAGLDLAAAEMRMAANACLDPVMIDDLNRKVDTHSLLTIMAYNLPYEIDLENPTEWVTAVKKNHEYQRQSTKNATFAVLYGGGLSAIAAQAKCDMDTAALLRRTIYERYAGLEKWIEDIHNQVRTAGTVSTRYGRSRIFPYSTGVFDNQQLQSMLREAQNYVIQSEASDYCLMGTVKFADAAPKHWDMWVQNLVHDALYVAVKEDYADEAVKLMVETMETADDLPARLYADGKYGMNWGSL